MTAPQLHAKTRALGARNTLVAVAIPSFDATSTWLEPASLRAAAEIGCAVLAIVVALTILRVRRAIERRNADTAFASGLLAMAILDGAHGLTNVREACGWSHALAILVGGTFFASVWIPSGRILALRARLPAVAAFVATALGIVIVAEHDALPEMSGLGALHPLAAGLGLGGGALLVLAAIGMRRDLADRSGARAVYALYCALVAVAAVAFLASSARDAGPWIWHAVRCAAVVGAFLALHFGLADETVRTGAPVREARVEASAIEATAGNGAMDERRALVAERARAEADASHWQAASQRSAAMLARVVEATPVGMLRVEASGRIAFANACAHRMFGYGPTELVGRQVEDLVPEASRNLHVMMRERFQAAPTSRAMGMGRALSGLRKDGTRFRLEIGLDAMETDEGPQVLACVIDVSEVVQQTRKLEHAVMELARSNADLDDFAYVASHDLRAPLRAISNLAQWIVEDARPVLPQTSKDHLDTLSGRIRRMESLLEDLLTYSRADRDDAAATLVDVGEILHEVVDLLGPPEGFEIEVRHPLPNAWASRAPLEQVFRNLIGNAIKHHDRPNGRIVVSGRDLGDCVEYTVADDGPGIPREFHERAFRMFQTLKPRDEVEGSGMGLAFVKRVVGRNGGQVRIASGDERGTSVIFTWRKSEEAVGVA